MKKLKKIKLSNIENSRLEKEQLIHLKGGYHTKVCSDGCSGAGNAVTVSIERNT
ncbi:MAG: TIGR04149 family rSAM-modified RiPP [Ignavibacteria bacterium]|nr:TIGR04149 family rSAM-modified RiPP [Ignavibacteria bacterium]